MTEKIDHPSQTYISKSQDMRISGDPTDAQFVPFDHVTLRLSRTYHNFKPSPELQLDTTIGVLESFDKQCRRDPRMINWAYDGVVNGWTRSRAAAIERATEAVEQLHRERKEMHDMVDALFFEAEQMARKIDELSRLPERFVPVDPKVELRNELVKMIGATITASTVVYEGCRISAEEFAQEVADTILDANRQSTGDIGGMNVTLHEGAQITHERLEDEMLRLLQVRNNARP